jgi:hypothetical protein
LKARLGHAQQAAIAMPGAWPPILVAALHLSCAASFQILLSCPALPCCCRPAGRARS